MWEQNDSYMKGKVINDITERGMKLNSDSATILTTDDEMRNMEMFSNFKKGPDRELAYNPLFPLNTTTCHSIPLIEAN